MITFLKITSVTEVGHTFVFNDICNLITFIEPFSVRKVSYWKLRSKRYQIHLFFMLPSMENES